ncbi:MAG: hypothetical protein ACUZ8N_06130 [Candidatus Scalindua sp.]
MNNKIEEISELIYQWSILYKQGAPKKTSNGMAMITSQDSKYQKKAEELYPEINESIVHLIELMKKHIFEIENGRR